MPLTTGRSPYIGGNTFSGVRTPTFLGIPQDAMMGLAATIGGILLMRKMNQRRDAQFMRRYGTSAQAPQEVPPVPALWDATKDTDPVLDEEDYATPPVDADGNLGLTRDPTRRRVASRFLGQGRYV